jgi:hypothetical protein
MHSCRPISVAFAVIIVALAIGQTPQTQAARAPLSPERLLAESDVVVVAEVTKIEIQKERARIERGFATTIGRSTSRFAFRKSRRGPASQPTKMW